MAHVDYSLLLVPIEFSATYGAISSIRRRVALQLFTAVPAMLHFIGQGFPFGDGSGLSGFHRFYSRQRSLLRGMAQALLLRVIRSVAHPFEGCQVPEFIVRFDAVDVVNANAWGDRAISFPPNVAVFINPPSSIGMGAFRRIDNPVAKFVYPGLALPVLVIRPAVLAISSSPILPMTLEAETHSSQGRIDRVGFAVQLPGYSRATHSRLVHLYQRSRILKEAATGFYATLNPGLGSAGRTAVFLLRKFGLEGSLAVSALNGRQIVRHGSPQEVLMEC